MITGFILLTINEDKKNAIYQQLTKAQNITEIHTLYGEYDLIVRINAESAEHLGNIICNTIQPLEGITSTKTILGSL